VKTPFPIGLPLTREDFETWFDDVYAIALRGAFRAKLTPACGVGIGHRGWNDVVTSNPSATRRETKHDALSSAVELVYVAKENKNPILGHRYNSVEHLAHTLRKVADGHAHRHLRVEKKVARLAPSPLRSGVQGKTANVVATTAENSAPVVRFVPKYVAYEKVPCPVCHHAEVALTTRRCPGCGVMVPHGATIQLPSEARGRLWVRALTETRRGAAAGRLDLAESHPHESMLPHEIPAPWTAGLQVAYRTGARLRRKANKARREVDDLLNKADDAREAEGAKARQFDRGAYVPAYVLQVDDEDSIGAQPARPVHRRRHPASPVPEPMTARQRLDYGLPIWRSELAREGSLVRGYESFLNAGHVPSEYRRRRPGPQPENWPTPRLEPSVVPEAVQSYRAKTVLIGSHLIAWLSRVADAADGSGEVPQLQEFPQEAPTQNTFVLADALIATRPDFAGPYDAEQRARGFRLLQIAFLEAGSRLDFESLAGEITRQYRVEIP